MSYNVIASTDQYSKIVEIREWNGTANMSLVLKDIIEVKGNNGAEKYTPHLPYEVQVPVIDLSNQIISTLRNRSFTHFKLIIRDKATNDLTYEGFINTRFTGHKYARPSNILTISSFDGITLLSTQDIPYTEDDRIPLGDLLQEIIHSTGIELDVVISTSIEHNGQSSPSGIIPNGIRVNPVSFVRGQSEPKMLDLLKAILNYFKFQMFQEDGVWRIVERDIRSLGSYTDYNITLGTSSTTDKSTTIQRSDLIMDPTEDGVDPARYERITDLGESSYSWKNPQLEYDVNDDGNITTLPDWIVNDQDKITGQFGGAKFLIFDALIYQRPLVALRSGTSFNFKFQAELKWKSGLDPGQGFIQVDIGEIIAYNTQSATYYSLNPSNRTWTSGGSDKVSAIISSESYAENVTFNFEGSTEELPAGNYNVIMRLFCQGDTGDLDELPRFINCNLSSSDAQLSKLTKRITHEPSPGELITESFPFSEPHRYLHWSDIEYYDGSNWQPTSNWGGGDSLDKVIMKGITKSSLNRDHVVSLPLHRNYLDMLNTVNYTVDNIERSYIPTYIKNSQFNKIQEVRLVETKLDEITGIRVRYEG